MPSAYDLPSLSHALGLPSQSQALDLTKTMTMSIISAPHPGSAQSIGPSTWGTGLASIYTSLPHCSLPTCARSQAVGVPWLGRFVGVLLPAGIAERCTAAALHMVAALGPLHHNAASGAMFPMILIHQPQHLGVLDRALVRRQLLKCRARVPLVPAWQQTGGTEALTALGAGRRLIASVAIGFLH